VPIRFVSGGKSNLIAGDDDATSSFLWVPDNTGETDNTAAEDEDNDDGNDDNDDSNTGKGQTV
jgi:hypothetical protein